MNRTILYSWEHPRAPQSFHTGVSLHSHTSASKEQLGFLTGFSSHFPIIPAILRLAGKQHQRATGEALDIQRAGWHPPLDPHAALRVESSQIRKLGLRPLVSLTDHDRIEGNLTLRRSGEETPISVEWTVPFGPTFFHLGVHNLPATWLWGVLQSYTDKPSDSGLAETLELLHSHPGVLTVLNHPFWDEGSIGAPAHAAAVRSFVERYGQWIDAIELNGLRSPAENDNAKKLASAWNKPLISGGDRHGAEPNANISLTNARTFSEFVHEIREGRSTILFLPQYREPLRLRWLQTVWDIVRTYPQADTARRRWSDRFFYRCSDGIERSVAEVWHTAGPLALSHCMKVLRVPLMPPFRPALRMVLADRAE